MTVRLCHPDLPGRVIEVPEEGVPFRRAAGWVPAPDLPPPHEPEDDQPDGDEPDVKAAPRRRRKTKEE